MRKRGASHSKLSIRPLGIKSTTFEFSARSSLVALEAGVATQSHIATFYVLADMAHRIGGADYVMTHGYSIKRLCEELHAQSYKASPLQYDAMKASVDVLVRYLHTQRNADIYRAAQDAISELGKC